DRYATSAAISAKTFPGTVPVVFIASGQVFPDALSAAPAASALGGPILLTDPAGLPTVIENELRRLSPARIIILGGEPSVGPGVQSRLGELTGAVVERWSGPDRYATSAAISAKTFPGTVPVVFIASGQVFPDALSAAPAASRLGGPILLAPGWGLPPDIIAELTRLKPGRIVLLGETPSVSSVVAGQAAFIGSDYPVATGDRLTTATEVRAGQCLASADAGHRLCVGTDGRFGVYRGATPLWTSGTTDPSVRALRIHPDGNVLLQSVNGHVIWESSTSATGADELVVQNDGDLMLTAPGGGIRWSSMSSATAPRWRLPFATGQSWAAGAPHVNSGGTPGARGSLDFGPLAGGDRRVLAIGDGTVYRIQCGASSYLGINHANGWQSTYYHLVNYQDHLVGQFVTAGTYLGDVGRTVPCGGGATFDHVHLTIRRAGTPVSVEGVRFGGYTVRSSGTDYWGFWTTAAEVRVLTAPGGAACCLTAG
ncbi:MAG TPA: cell wall-binding repeat-containing protein, partial [Microbacterium sp.]|nr:cell wall-binding repeat-containing protein [Microbacterium sp.]